MCLTSPSNRESSALRTSSLLRLPSMFGCTINALKSFCLTSARRIMRYVEFYRVLPFMTCSSAVDSKVSRNLKALHFVVLTRNRGEQLASLWGDVMNFATFATLWTLPTGTFFFQYLRSSFRWLKRAKTCNSASKASRSSPYEMRAESS